MTLRTSMIIGTIMIMLVGSSRISTASSEEYEDVCGPNYFQNLCIDIMIMEMLLVLMSLSNGTDTSDDIDTVCSSDRPYQQDLVDRSYCNDNYYCKNYYGDNEGSAQDLLLRTWCD